MKKIMFNLEKGSKTVLTTNSPFPQNKTTMSSNLLLVIMSLTMTIVATALQRQTNVESLRQIPMPTGIYRTGTVYTGLQAEFPDEF